MSEIKFERTPAYKNLGRNGSTEACGINVNRIGDEIVLTPINSRDALTRCQIVIPSELAVTLATMIIEAGGE